MRIRSTKPEFWRSARIASVDWDARLVLKGLESYVDDNGVGKDDIALIVAEVFPRDMLANPRETVARVSEAISVLSEAGLVWRYEASGTRLLYLAWWDDFQRIDKPGKGRFPRPDGTMDYKESSIRESVASPPETLAPGTGEQGNRGTGEQQTCATELRDCPPRFDDFWAAYPRRRDRRKAEKAFAAALKRADANTIIDGARRYANDPNRAEQFTKYAEGWLNGDGWLDEPLPPRNGMHIATSDRRVAEVQALKSAPSQRLELE